MTSTWTTAELDRIGSTDELDIAARRQDGSLRTPTTIWVVRHGDDLFVRSYRGQDGAWYRATKLRGEGHIQVAGIDKDVTFVAETDPDTNAQIDAAYQAKYRSYEARYLDPMVTAAARSTTTRLLPRGDHVQP